MHEMEMVQEHLWTVGDRGLDDARSQALVQSIRPVSLRLAGDQRRRESCRHHRLDP